MVNSYWYIVFFVDSSEILHGLDGNLASGLCFRPSWVSVWFQIGKAGNALESL